MRIGLDQDDWYVIFTTDDLSWNEDIPWYRVLWIKVVEWQMDKVQSYLLDYE